MLDILKAKPGCNVNHVAGHFAMSRIAVMKHLAVLEKAGLIHSEKAGRDRKLFANVVPIQMIYDRWTTEYSAIWAERVTRLKYEVEAQSSRDEEEKGEKENNDG
ncbi:MAG: ArsR/SmtB family transcription factor [Phycisphaerae bacterium]